MFPGLHYRDERGAHFSIGSIRSINPLKAGGYLSHEITFDDGEKIAISESDVEQILQRPVQIIPALPGTSICQVMTDLREIFRTPVIAWALCVDGEMRPMSTSGIDDSMCLSSGENLAVEMPNGTICETGFDGLQYTDAVAFIAAKISPESGEPDASANVSEAPR